MRNRGIVLLCSALAVAGCQGAPPPLGAGLPGGTWATVSQVFDARVKARFPVGSSESSMLLELGRQKFLLSLPLTVGARYSVTAVRDVPGFPCRRHWSVTWSTHSGLITDIAGSYSGTCL